MRIQICLVVSAALLAGGVAFADEDINVPVRPIGVNGQEAWNGRATSFLYAPTFGFKAIEGAAKYRFSVNGKIFEAATPTAALSPVWGEIPVGWVKVEARGVAADGRDLGVAGSRRLWKKAAYRPGAYPPAARPYGKAAELAFLNVLNSKSIAILEKTGDIDRAYPHNCYPAKMLAQVVTGMLELAKMRPDLKARALGVAEKAADWMIAHSIAAPSPLAGFPVTYDHHPEAAKVEPTACARISKERTGISMNIYPGYMGRAYVALYEADGKAKYLAAAEAIAARYLAMQGWPTHKSNIPTPGVLTAGLKLARPDQKAWRVGCVGVSDDLEVLESSVAGIRALLGKESTVTAYTPAGLNEALAKNELDVVVYPFDESYPLETADAVIGFVRDGGVLVDFGGCPMYYARKDGAHVEKAADGTLNRDKMHAALRLTVAGPRAENGLKYNQRFYATKAGEAAGLKYDPEGVRCFRFFSDAKLRPGDEMIPLLTAKGTNGKDGVGACVVRFGSDFKGALVLTGSADGRSGSSEAAQARNCLDMIEISRQAGIERLFFYEFRAPEKDPYYSEDHFGIVHKDFSPKPAYELLRRELSSPGF